MFSFHWFNGLRGSADVSLDNKVTLNEAYQYAYRKTLETSALTNGEMQHPMYRFNVVGQGDIVLTDLNSGSSGIVVDKSCKGKFLVLSENYLDVFADFYKKANCEQFISLFPGTYTIVNAQGTDVSTSVFEVGRNQRVVINQSVLIPNNWVESRIKGPSGPDTTSQGKSSPSNSLSRYGAGPDIGVSLTKNDGAGFAIGFANRIIISDNSDMFIDFNWNMSGMELGAVTGLDISKKLDQIRLFAGGGIGCYYNIGGTGNEFGYIAPCVTAHAGLRMSITDHSTLQIRMPFTFNMGSSKQYRMGVQLGVLFAG